MKSVSNGQIVKPNIGPRLQSVPPHRSFSEKPAASRSPQIQVAPDNRSEVRNIKRDITLLFKTIETLQHGMTSVVEAVEDLKSRLDVQSSPSEDLWLLTENVTQVNRRLGEVDSLKLEMKLMQSKIARLEDERSSSSNTRAATSKRSIGPHKAPMAISKSRSEKSMSEHVISPQIEPSFMNPQSEQLADCQSTARSSIASSNNGFKPRNAAEAAHRRSHLYKAVSALKENRGQKDGGAHIPAHGGADESSDATEPDEEHLLNPEEEEPSDDSDDEDPIRSSHRAFRFIEQDNYVDGTFPPGKRRRTTPSHLSPDLTPEYPSPPSVRRPSGNTTASHEGSSYRSIWAPECGTFRNERGFVVTRDGRIDGRSLRFEGKGHYKRDGPRDEEGYLLKVDGSRDKRSVRIIDGMKKRREERERIEREMKERADRGGEEKAGGKEVINLVEGVVEDTISSAGASNMEESGMKKKSDIAEAERHETDRETTADKVTMQLNTPEADTAPQMESGVYGQVRTAISV